MSGNAVLVKITGMRPIVEDGHPALPGYSDMSNSLTPLMAFISNPTAPDGYHEFLQLREQDRQRGHEIVRVEAAERATERLRLELRQLDAHNLNFGSMADREMQADITQDGIFVQNYYQNKPAPRFSKRSTSQRQLIRVLLLG